MRPGLGFGQHHFHLADTIDWAAAHVAVDLLSGKWTIPVIAALLAGPRRHGDLRRAVNPRMSDKVLTQTLRRMEATELVTRHAVEGNPPVVSYQLSTLGRSLTGPLTALARWHSTHRPHATTREERTPGSQSG
jgi:DNA-binding HxlR family transcriptional regulator